MRFRWYKTAGWLLLLSPTLTEACVHVPDTEPIATVLPSGLVAFS
jgi:hypothetical protein